MHNDVLKPDEKSAVTASESSKKNVKLPNATLPTSLSRDETPKFKKPLTTVKSELEIEFNSPKAPDAPEKQKREEDANAKKDATLSAPDESGKEKRLTEPSKPALSDWSKQEINGKVHHRSGKDHVVDEGGRIKGTTGSKHEVEAMFELARSKNWTGMAFSGSDEFKKQVMELALKNNCDVIASGKDLQLLNEVKKNLGKDPLQKDALSIDASKTAERKPTEEAVSPQQDTKNKRLPDKVVALKEQSEQSHSNSAVDLPKHSPREESKTVSKKLQVH